MPLKSRPLRISRAPEKPLRTLESRALPLISQAPRVSSGHASCAPAQISRPSGLARPLKSRAPRVSRDPSSAPGPRTRSSPRPRARCRAGPRRSPRERRGRRAPPPAPGPPTHFSRAWLSEGTAEPLPPLAYMLLRAAAAAGAHTCQAAPGAALVVAIATPRPGPHRPEPRAGTAGIVRAGELQTAAAAAAVTPASAPAAGFIFFLSSLSAGCSGKRAPPPPAARAPARRPRAPLLKGQ